MSIPSSIPSLLTAKVRPMTAEQSQALMSLLLVPATDEFTQERAQEFGPASLVLKQRLDLGKIKITTPLAYWLLALSEGNPGRIVQWAFAARELFLKKNQESKGHVVDVRDWVDFFPMGVPTEDEYSRLWDAQKTPDYRNALDNEVVWRTDGAVHGL